MKQRMHWRAGPGCSAAQKAADTEPTSMSWALVASGRCESGHVAPAVCYPLCSVSATLAVVAVTWRCTHTYVAVLTCTAGALPTRIIPYTPYQYENFCSICIQ
jgi:hypothetical protein